MEGAELESIEGLKHLHYSWECALQYTVSNQTTFLTNETIFKAYYENCTSTSNYSYKICTVLIMFLALKKDNDFTLRLYWFGIIFVEEYLLEMIANFKAWFK